MVQTGRNGGLTSLFSRGGDSSSTLVLLDGMPLTDPGGAINLANLTNAGIDRMEVIRGPESALFGAEASQRRYPDFFASWRRRIEYAAWLGLLRARIVFDRSLVRFSSSGGLAKKIDYSFTTDQLRTTGEFPNDAYRDHHRQR